MTTKPADLTSLQQKLEARRPHERKIPIKGFPGIENESVVVRVLRKAQTNDAKGKALARIEKLAEKVPALREDDVFAREQQTIQLLYSAARDASDPDGMPAFPSPEWMEKNLATAEFDYLLAAYNQLAGDVYPGGRDQLDPEKFVALLDTCATHASTDLPNQELLLFSREILAEMIIRAAILRRDALNEAEDIRARLDALVAAGFVPPEESDGEIQGDTLSIHAARLVASEPANDLLANAAPRIRTARDAELVMSMLGWKEGSPAWRRVLGEESGTKVI